MPPKKQKIKKRRKPFPRTPKKIVVTVKENPMDKAAAKYIKQFGCGR